MPHLPPKKMAGCPFGQATHLQVRLIRGPGAPSLGTRCCMCFLSGQKMSSGRWNIFGAPKKVPKVHPIPIPNMYMNIWIYIYICIIYNYILYIYIYDVIYTTSYFFSWKLLCFTVSPSGQTHTEGRWVPDILLWIHVQTLRTSNVSCISSHLGWFYRASGSCPPSSSNLIKSPLFSTMHIASLQNPLTPPGFLCSVGWCTCGKPMTVNHAIYIHLPNF